MSIEAALTRQLGIRFIDARELSTEAKITLGIVHYPNKTEQEEIIDVATTIFQKRSPAVRGALRRMKSDFEKSKTSMQRRADVFSSFELLGIIDREPIPMDDESENDESTAPSTQSEPLPRTSHGLIGDSRTTYGIIRGRSSNHHGGLPSRRRQRKGGFRSKLSLI